MLDLTKLAGEPIVFDHYFYNYFAVCPITSSPILYIVDDGDPEESEIGYGK